MISQTTEYALRAVVFLAQHPEDSWTTQQIAEATKVPAGYLSKVLQGLSRAGLVTSQRGRHGGFQLGHPPYSVSVLQIVNAVEPIRRIHQCPLEIGSHGAALCPLHSKLDETIATVEQSFQQTTLADLLGRPGTNEPLCEFPHGSGQEPRSRLRGKPAEESE